MDAADWRFMARTIPVVRADLKMEGWRRRVRPDHLEALTLSLAARRQELDAKGHPAAQLAADVLEVLDARRAGAWDEATLEAIVERRDAYGGPTDEDGESVADTIRHLLHDAKYHVQAAFALPEARERVQAMAERAADVPEVVTRVLETLPALVRDSVPSDDALDAAERLLGTLEGQLPPTAERKADRLRERAAIREIIVLEDHNLWAKRVCSVAEEVAEGFDLTVEPITCARELEECLKSRRPAANAPWSTLFVLDLAVPRERPLSADLPPRPEDTIDPPRPGNTINALTNAFPAGEGAPPIVVLTNHVDELDRLVPQWVDRVDFISKDVGCLDDIEETLAVLETRIRDQVVPLTPANCELRVLDFSGCQVEFNGVLVTLTLQQFGVLQLLAHDSTARRPSQVPAENLIELALLSPHLNVRPHWPREFWEAPLSYFGGKARDAEQAILKQLPAGLRPAGALVEEDSGPDGRLGLGCRSEVVHGPHARRREPFRVLIVEDDPEERRLLVDSLRAHFEVEAVADEEGLEEALSRQTFPAVVLDLEFPERPGAPLDGPRVGVGWHLRLLRDPEVGHVVVYSRHDRQEVRSRLDKAFQGDRGLPWRERVRLEQVGMAFQRRAGGRGLHWRKRVRPPDVVPKRGRRATEIATIIAHLTAAERDYRRFSATHELGCGSPPHELKLCLEAGGALHVPPRDEADLRRRFSFLLNGRLCTPWRPAPTPGREHGARVTLTNRWLGYHLVRQLALAPERFCWKFWLAERLILRGVLALVPGEAPDEKCIDRMVAAIRAGASAGAGVDDLIECHASSYRVNARVSYVDLPTWHACLEEAGDGHD